MPTSLTCWVNTNHGSAFPACRLRSTSHDVRRLHGKLVLRLYRVTSGGSELVDKRTFKVDNKSGRIFSYERANKPGKRDYRLTATFSAKSGHLEQSSTGSRNRRF